MIRGLVCGRGIEEVRERGNKMVVDQLVELFEDEIVVDGRLRRRGQDEGGLEQRQLISRLGPSRVNGEGSRIVMEDDRLRSGGEALPGRESVPVGLRIVSAGWSPIRSGKVGGMLEVMRMRLGGREASEHFRSCRLIDQWIRRRRQRVKALVGIERRMVVGRIGGLALQRARPEEG
ncbi:uncharacterized protein PGTG_19011 [Puccinia graminis f. sp. tritici CRL 75-36-700-3]|uniref:Uncharacterized protein n=1 Tax=Puccinia graminis f. sp. tritici (strain CRL 75-36-700-3 / race SCCL) TaxID=418459 RepID=E3L8X3_PUCGT|nr:uncharacterized protein PGTG_19011 [Puccinia graminis f. sp. tritici CRL 75-36-700-3]EFP92998.1 hypothetical protein PGTG_19011 [Puccinia graminis f. sp. tritici CRL 75-36-700-3]